MNVTISLGSWLIPTAFMIIAFGVAYAKHDRRVASDYGAAGLALWNAGIYGLALIASLIAWLVWALLT